MVSVFPFLRQLCKVLGLDFQIVDMRWGVLDDRRYNWKGEKEGGKKVGKAEIRVSPMLF
jgi:hypothetical protein